ARFQGHRAESGYKLDVQAKATTRGRLIADHVRYDIDVPAYDALRLAPPEAPRILVVLLLPSREGKWIVWTEKALLLRRCAYWVCLQGWPPTLRRRSIRLRIPRGNVFSPAALRGIMERIRRREKP